MEPTAAAGVLTLVLPATLSLLSDAEVRNAYKDGFRTAALMVVFVLVFGAIVASIRRRPAVTRSSEPEPVTAEP